MAKADGSKARANFEYRVGGKDGSNSRALGELGYGRGCPYTVLYPCRRQRLLLAKYPKRTRLPDQLNWLNPRQFPAKLASDAPSHY
jgi:hypothetical protein